MPFVDHPAVYHRTNLMSAPALRASMKALVPDLAMVPRLLTRSALVMPIPESSMVRVLLAWKSGRRQIVRRRILQTK